MLEPVLRLRERAQELGVIDDALGAVAGGSGRVLAVEGPAGIGKTSLVAAAVRRAEAAGMAVLSARGGELERDFAWGVVHQLIEPALYRAGADERGRWFSGAAALSRPLFEDPHELGRPNEPESQFRRRHGLHWLVANLAQDRPLLLVVDDA